MIDRSKYESLADALADVDDLDRVRAALVREHAVRHVMAETGEDRQTVTDMIDAMEATDQEGVLDLTEGQPTTLRDALERYLERLGRALEGDPGSTLGDVEAELGALLAYPWPEEEATISTHGENASVRLSVDYPDDDHLTVSVGGHEVYSGSYDELGSSGMGAVEEVARGVHRALLARVIGDREHLVRLNDRERRALLEFAQRASGSWRPEGNGESGRRLSVDAVEGGGLLIRTRPYRYVTPPRTR
ncbi:MAG TPA: hypothetical protein VFU47_02605 [Armatimonadota bacterium]|nr:hypothetical protein [Armatimonadota bacterium]